jgi:hypothetical protein
MENNVRKVANLTRLFVLTASLTAMACGGSKDGDTTPQPDVPTGPQPQDIAHEYDGATFEGMTFAPEALEWPGVPAIKIKGRLPKLDKQRKKLEKQKKLGATDVHTMVTLLVNAADKADNAGNAEAGNKARQEATMWLTKLAEQAGDEVTEITLKRLAAVQFPLDEAASAATYQQLLVKFPDSEAAKDYRTWLAYALLRAGNNDGAAEIVNGWQPGAIDARADYVLAWVNYRARDWGAATAAIGSASTSWTGPGKPGLLRDAKLILARAGAPVDTAMTALRAILPADKPQLLTLHAYQLHEAYMFSGHYAEAAETLDAIFDNASQSDQVTFRINQADYMYRVGKPAAAAQKVKQALDLCAGWAECPEQLQKAAADRALLLARVYHNTYATSLDVSYANAAKVLYELYLGITPPPADKAEVDGNANNLAQHVQNSKPEMGKHAKDAMELVAKAHGEQLQACYEAALQSEPELAGSVKITIDVAADGAVGGVVTEPGAGKDGLAAAAGCIQKRVKDWSFPARSVPGLTRLIYPASFKPKAPAAPATPAAPAAPAAPTTP